ncbi:MAG: hypothetical protein OXH73_13595 [Caldilineaceae bacterium]|nr:hypothetical protein [Caldilineaceae bacterium]
MSLTMLTVDAAHYVSYATLAEANAYLRVEPALYGGWNALTDEEKSVRLIAATRRIDLLPWAGQALTAGQAWPRTGVTYADGSDVPHSVAPLEVERAVIWLAGNVNLPLSPAANLSGLETGVQSRRVGPRTTTFYPRRRSELELQIPARVRRLVGAFLASTAAVGAPLLAFDGPETSGFRDLLEREDGLG